MKNQALFSLKDKSKKLKCRLLQFLFGTLRLKEIVCSSRSHLFPLILLHSERPKLHTILVFLSAIGLRVDPILAELCSLGKRKLSHKSCPLCKTGRKTYKCTVHLN